MYSGFLKGRSWSAGAFLAPFLLCLLLLTGSAQAGTYQLQSQFGTSGSEEGELHSPAGLAVLNYAGADYIFVADSGNDRVQIFDAAGGFQGGFGVSGSGEGEFSGPSGIAVTDDLTVYVADSGNNRVQALDAGGGFQRFLGSGLALAAPVGVAIDSQGDVLVSEASAGRVSRFDASGAFISSFGQPGNGPGDLNLPVGLAVDASDNVLVADSLNHRIQTFNSSGQFLSGFGSQGSGEGEFDLPFSLAIGPAGLFVIERSNLRIQQLTTSGGFTSSFGDFGSGPASPGRPGWLAIGSDGDVYVSDEEGDRILRYAVRNTLSAGSAGSGSGSITSAPAGLDCDSDCSVGFAPGSAVTLTASAAPGSVFVGWSGEGCSGTGTCQLAMDSDRAVTATFVLNRSLSVSRTGKGSGLVTSDPAGIDCGGSCETTFVEGTPVTLTADPSSGSTFTGWSGGGCSGTGPCTVTMDLDRQVTAEFTPVVKPAPKVKVTSKPSKKTRSKKAEFAFRSSVPGSKFKCRLDKGKFAGCSSPKKYRKLKPGKHKLSIRAIAGGRTGPAVNVKWTVKR